MEENKGTLQLESQIVSVLRQIYDPEIPVNIFDLGLIYEIDVDDKNFVKITMTMTAPNCPMADELFAEVNDQVQRMPGVSGVEVKLTFDPPWSKEMMSEEAMLDLGLL